MEYTLGQRLGTDESFAFNTLINVFKYFNFRDLWNCSQVCRTWYWIVKTDSLWKNISVYSCARHVFDAVDVFGSKFEHLEIMDTFNLPLDSFQELFPKVPLIKEIGLHRCHTEHLKILADMTSKKLKELTAEVCCGQTDLNFFGALEELNHLNLTITHEILRNVHFLPNLKKLTHLKLFMFIRGKRITDDLISVQSLKSLCLNMGLQRTFFTALFKYCAIKQLRALTKLQIDNVGFTFEYDILDNLSTLSNLKELILLKLSTTVSATLCNFKLQLANLSNITHLTISLNRSSCFNSIIHIALENSEVFNGVIALKESLKYFCWQMDELAIEKAQERSHSTDDVITMIPYRVEVNMFVLDNEVTIIPLSKLARGLQRRMPLTEVVIVKIRDLDVVEKRRVCCYQCGMGRYQNTLGV